MIRKGAALAVVVVLAGLVGCGGGLSKVEGEVTLDGKAVEGAMVTFVPSDDSGTPATGQTDSAGKFTLNTLGKPGAKQGEYKVTVVKVAPVSGVEDKTMKPGSPEYEKAMKDKMGKGAAGGQPGGMGMMGMKGMPGAGATVKSDLPQVYATTTSTPLTAKVPHSGPVKLELASKK